MLDFKLIQVPGEGLMDTVLSARGIFKSFASINALNNVDFDLNAGEVHALLGVNGAGKSVFVKILSGLLHKDSGQLVIDGKPVEIANAHDAEACGIASVQQRAELVNDLLGYENIYLGREATDGAEFKSIDSARLKRQARELAEQNGFDVDVGQPLRTMTAVEREMIAILQALSTQDIRVLILDEPTSILTEAEKNVLFRLIRNIAKRGVGVIYITHRLDEVFEIAQRLTVFRGGKVVATEVVDELDRKGEHIAELMLGTRMGEMYPTKTPKPGEVFLEAEALFFKNGFEDVSFTARRGEVLGVFGLLGSGLDELSKVIAGDTKPDKGRLIVKGSPVRFRAPKEALRRGIFMVPGDRWLEGLTPSQDVIFNTSLANLGRVSMKGGILRKRMERKQAQELATLVDLQPLDIRRPAATFSGGNQQKVVMAKGLFTKADIYLFVEPTVGVDIGARAKIYSLIRQLAEEHAVVVMSSDCDEVYGLADTVLTLYKGRPTMSASAAEVSREEVLLGGLVGQTGKQVA